MSKYRFFLCLMVFTRLLEAYGAPVSTQQARSVVEGWLRLDSTPLDDSLGQTVSSVDTYSDTNSIPVFYVHTLEAGGFVVTSADDYINPIIAFSDTGTFDSSTNSPLWNLLYRDMQFRQKVVREYEANQTTVAAVASKTASATDPLDDTLLESKSKWDRFAAVADVIPGKTGTASVSDVRISPMVQSTWNQETVSGLTCYNYYTPNHYPCGCVATAMAQLMRYHEYPTAAIGVQSRTIWVDDVAQSASTQGGNESGGAYSWSSMPLNPGSGITLVQRQAIGALCYDAGVASSMYYTSDGSGTYEAWAADGLLSIFDYSNAIYYMNYGYNMTTDFRNRVINCNLDAGFPVMVGITDSSSGSGHEIVCDGYGYNNSTLYHHMNMGWGGSEDMWYALPDIDAYYGFDIVDGFVYNVFPTGSGEIISGRVVDSNGDPLSGVTVSAGSYSDVTDEQGIYALSQISAGTYSISASKDGYESGSLSKTITASYDYYGENSADYSSCGNQWGVDFTLAADSGSYQSWLSNGSVPADQQGYLDTPAGDGVANIWKYAAGLSPLAVCSMQDVYSCTNDLEGNRFSLIYREAKDVSQSTMTAEWSSTVFGPWVTNGMIYELVGTNPTQEIWQASIAFDEKGFIRLSVELDTE